MNKEHAKKIINAYRMGTVSADDILPYVNRNALNQRLIDFTEDLNTGISRTLLYCGDYGTGKTHSLKYTAKTLLNKRYIVSTCSISKVSSFSKIGNFYRQIMQNLKVETLEGNTSFDEIFSLWIDNLRSTPNKALAQHEISWVIDKISQYNDTFARVFLKYIRALLKKDHTQIKSISAWLRGDAHIPSSLKKSFDAIGTIDANVALEFLMAFSQLINLMGYKGFVILVDECDVILSMRRDIRLANYQTIRALIDLIYADNLSVFGLVLGITPSMLKDDERGIPAYPALAQRLNIQNWQHAQHILNLNGILEDEKKEILLHLIHIYQVYNEQPTQYNLDEIYDTIERDSQSTSLTFRDYFQRAVQCFDHLNSLTT